MSARAPRERPARERPAAALPAMRTRALIAWVWRSYLRRQSPLVAAAVALMVLEGASFGFLSWMMQPMFDRVFVGGERAAIGWIVAAISGSFVVRAVAGIGQRALIAQAAERAALAMQAEVLAHLVRLDQRFYKAHPPGMLIERVRGDTAMLQTFLNGVVVPVARDTVALVSLVGVAVSIDPVWALVALVGTPLLVWPVTRLQRAVRRTTRAARAAAAQAAVRLDEIFHGIGVIQLSGIEARETGRYAHTLASQIRAQVTAQTASAAIPAMIDLVAAAGFAAVVAWGGAEVAGGGKTVGQFMAFFTAMGLAFDPLRRLAATSGALQMAVVGFERVRALLDEPVRIASPAVVRAAARPGAVAFEGVTFAYDEAPVLRDLSFRAEPGQRTALVGRSGAGKTTVFTLLTRQADPQAGRITLAGTDLRDLALPDLRAQFSTVSQEPVLFDETIRDNILLGRGDVPPAALEAALEAARVTEFLPRLPRGLDTAAGPRGSALSGGQRQRVAIARAILRDAPVLLLDEATSALDSANEALVTEALERLSAGRMTLVIAHRLSTVQDADRILVLDRGALVDAGRHDELIARGGLYADLCRLQFGA